MAEVPLPARTDVAGLAWQCVHGAAAAAASLAGRRTPALSPAAVAVAYTAERHVRIDGARPAPFAPLSGFFAADDGWVRTHGNYAHHAERLRAALDLAPDAGPEALAAAISGRRAAEVAARVTAAGGLCVVVAAEDPAADARLAATPLVPESRVGDAPPRPLHPDAEAPLRGVRVLDLTRVIAGPTATQLLALLGASVLRIDPPGLSEPPLQHLATGHGKRTALLDLAGAAGRRRFASLLAEADVVALGYRPAALARLGLSPAALAARREGLVVLQLRAWPDANRRGFDSLVQASSGIALVEGSPGAPGVLPAQALDYSAGFLLATAAIELLRRRADVGGSWLAETSLRRIAAELLRRPRTAEPTPRVEAAAPPQPLRFEVAGREVITAPPPFTLGSRSYAPPRPWGGDPAQWW